MKQVVKLLRVERAAGMVGKACNAIFFCFRRYVFTVHFFEPAGCQLRPFKAETSRIQHFFQWHLAPGNRHDLGLGIKRMQNGVQRRQLVFVDQVGLADQQHITEFDLVDQQVSDVALVVLTQAFTSLCQALGFAVLFQKISTIDHGDHGIQAGDLGKTLAIFTFKGESFRDR